MQVQLTSAKIILRYCQYDISSKIISKYVTVEMFPPSLDDTQLEAQQIKHDWNILLTLSSSTIKAGVTIPSGYPAGEIEQSGKVFRLIVHTLSAGSNLK